MANIALQDGKVVLKDGKASCACCDTAICGCSSIPVELKTIIESATTIQVVATRNAFNGERSTNSYPLPWDGVSVFSPDIYPFNYEDYLNYPYLPTLTISYQAGKICINSGDAKTDMLLSPLPFNCIAGPQFGDECPFTYWGTYLTINGNPFRTAQYTNDSNCLQLPIIMSLTFA
jgi:hypothetical protein